MTTFFILIGFAAYFLGVGSIINNIRKVKDGRVDYKKVQNLGLLLWGFIAVYGIAISVYLSKLSEYRKYSAGVLIISIFIGVCLFPSAAILFFNRKKAGLVAIKQDKMDVEKTMTDEASHVNDYGKKENPEKWSKKDFLAITAITIIGAVMIFYRLGSFDVPQSGLRLVSSKEAENEIILDFGEEAYIKEMYIFLGHMDSRKVAVSYFDEGSDEWIVISEDSEAESVYNWNKLEIDRNVRYLGIVSKNTIAVYNEIVILGNEEQKLLPLNKREYDALFDEQELFPTDITYYYGTMFDEVYYSRSAYELLQGMDMFEYTHPPLGKILMAIGIALFGVTPFGWRFICAVFGVFMLPVLYLFARKVTGKTKYAAFGASLCGLDFMHLTLSRIATIDSMVAFFIVAMFTIMFYLLCELKDRLHNERYEIKGSLVFYVLIGAVATGCGVAVKWTGFYAAAGIAVLFLIFVIYQFTISKANKRRRLFIGKVTILTGIIFTFFTMLIYLLSYIPMSLAQNKNLFSAMWDNSLAMLSFHSNIVFDHPYSSAWYTWPLDLVPLIDAISLLNGNVSTISEVATFGNPVIWWGGLAAFCFLLYRAVFRKDRTAGYLTLSYIAMLLPWCFIKRTVFIYQYYACSLILCVILAYASEMIDRHKEKFSAFFLEAALLCIIMFYPIITGIPVNGYTIKLFMEWLSRWKFV